MSFQIGNGCLPAAITHDHINMIARSDTPLTVSLWEKIKAFFCSTHKPEALELIRKICHPRDGTTWQEVVVMFERLRTLAYGGFDENIQSGRYGEDFACILDENGREMLSVTLEDDGNYVVTCQGYSKTYNLNVTKPSQNTRDYEAIWSAWEKAAPAKESSYRAIAAKEMRYCLNNKSEGLHLNGLFLTSLPSYLPPDIIKLSIVDVPLNRLPALPEGLRELKMENNQLISLPALPKGLQKLKVEDNRLACLPALPKGLQELKVESNNLLRLPALPAGLKKLSCSNNCLTSLPVLPAGLESLEAGNNLLNNLPALPGKLKTLSVPKNQLGSLQFLPAGLKALDISDNKLTNLQVLPEGLEKLSCKNNQLTSPPINISDPAPEAFSGNPFSAMTSQKQSQSQSLESGIDHPGDSEPKIFFSMDDLQFSSWHPESRTG